MVVADTQLSIVNPKLTIQKMKFFKSRVRVRRIIRARREAHQHADAILRRVDREDLATESRRNILPVRLIPKETDQPSGRSGRRPFLDATFETVPK